jgi:hypothetical protein
MPEREQWRVMGNAAEIYQRALVPAIFGRGPLVSLSSPGGGPGSACSTLRAEPGSSRAWRPRRLARMGELRLST